MPRAARGGHRAGAPGLTRYARARWAGDLLFLAGVSGRRPDDTLPGVRTGESGAPEIDVRAQTESAIANLGAALAEHGLELAHLIDVTCFLVSMNDYAGFVEVWNRHFDADGPTRTTVAVHQLPDPGLAVELKAVAARAPR